jgi:hypothetical protein
MTPSQSALTPPSPPPPSLNQGLLRNAASQVGGQLTGSMEMDDLAAIVVSKLKIRDGMGEFVLVGCQHDPHLVATLQQPDTSKVTKIPTIVVSTFQRSSGETAYQIAYLNVASKEHCEVRNAGGLPSWTLVTYNRPDVASAFVFGFLRRFNPFCVSLTVDLHLAGEVDQLFFEDDKGAVLAPHEGIKFYDRFDKHAAKIATHTIPDLDAMRRAMLTLSPLLVRRM